MRYRKAYHRGRRKRGYLRKSSRIRRYGSSRGGIRL